MCRWEADDCYTRPVVQPITLHDPSIVDQVETLEEAVVGELPLELGQRPTALLRQGA